MNGRPLMRGGDPAGIIKDEDRDLSFFFSSLKKILTVRVIRTVCLISFNGRLNML